MSEQGIVIFDVNFFARLRELHPECELYSLISLSFNAVGYGDQQQIQLMDYCKCLSSQLHWHDVSDEKILEFIHTYRGNIDLAKIYEDPTDIKLLVFAKQSANSLLLSCDARLLRLSEDQSVPHHCFKAAIGYANDQFENGIFEDPAYNTDIMFTTGPEPSKLFIHDPFFRYGIDKKCHLCDPSRRCKYRCTTNNS